MDKIKAIMDSYAAKVTGHLGIGFMDFQTGETCFLNPDDRFPSASTFKVPLLTTLMARAEAGEIDLDSLYTLQQSDISPGSGVLATLTPGVTMRIRDYAMLMMIVSDNTATDIMCNLVGLDNVAAKMAELGLTNTLAGLTCKDLIYTLMGIPLGTPLDEAMAGEENGIYTEDDTLYTDFSIPNDYTSPRDMITLFSLIYKKEILTPAACDTMLHIMGECQTNSRIPYNLPRGVGVKVIHKTGTLDNVACDSGVIEYNGKSFALALYYNAHTATDAEKSTLHFNDYLFANLTREIFDAVHGA